MSINITVHGSPSKRYTKKKILFDTEGNKKKLFEERRRLRLEQVRQKSKEIASQVRKNVDKEKQKQLKKIEETKKEELKTWKRKIKNQINDIIPEIGEAHRAAEKSNCTSDAIFHQLNKKESLDIIPAVPNKNVIKSKNTIKRAYNSNNKENNNCNIIGNPKSEVIEKSEEVNSCFDELKNNKINCHPRTKRDTRNFNQNVSTTTFTKKYENKPKKSVSSFEQPTFKSYASFKDRNTNSNLKKTPSLIMSLGSSETSLDSSSSSLEIQDVHDETNQHFSRIYSKRKTNLAPAKYNSNEFSAPVEQPLKSTRTKFTQISDFINKNQKTGSTATESTGFFSEKGTNALRSEEKDQPKKVGSWCDKNFNEILSEDLVNKRGNETVEYKTIMNKSKESIQNQLGLNSENMARNTQKLSFKTLDTKDQSTSMTTQQLTNVPLENKFKTKSLPNLQQKLPPRIELSNVISSYDYNNRFEKTMNSNKLTKVSSQKFTDETTNATDNADIERQLQKSREKELEILKKKSEERGQKALEREKVRRDYELLEAKLEALTKDKQLAGSFSNIRDNISEVRIKQMENERINKINNSIENIIRRPVVITLPEISKDYTTTQFVKDDLKMGINLANLGEDSGTINSTDSCCSILLNYVDNQTKQINKDIKNADNNQKSKRLKELLNKLENLKTNLVKELEKSENSTENKNVQTMFDSISGLRQEREKIMLLDTEKKDLQKREKDLKKREAILEKKLREFYDVKRNKTENLVDTEKTNQKKSSPQKTKIQEDSMNVQYTINETNSEFSSRTDETQDESSECIAKKVVSVNKPVEIVIKVKEPLQKTPYKAVRKKASLIQKNKQFTKKYNSQKVSTPVRTADDSECTSSTVYKSPPETMRTELGQMLGNKTKLNKDVDLKKDAATITESDELIKNKTVTNKDVEFQKDITKINTDAARKCKEKILKELKRVKEIPELKKTIEANPIKNSQVNKPMKKSVTKETNTVKPIKQNLIHESSRKPIDPVLAQYIHRLLGMSRHSVNMLGVSTSDIETPSSSVINVPSNISTPNVDSEQHERIKRIQNFINDNYSFVSEIEESLKREDKSNAESDESLRLIEEIWKKSLKQQTTTKKLKDSPPKPILKKKIENEKLKIKEKEKFDSEEKKEDDPSAEEKVIEKYTELTDNCTQRIAELNEMIERVRKEKQKILEITLSSNGGGNSDTEYLDFEGKSKADNAGKRTKKTENEKIEIQGSTKKAEQITNYIPPINSIPETPIKEPDDSIERVQLEKNKLTGVSRDSGISLSRPLTALDHRDSPDIRDKIEETSFEPFLKDIPKPNTININKPTVVNMTSISVTKQMNYAPIDMQSIKKNKPPASISRYSPQLIEDIPHELSTILEIDTPATSRLNATIKESIIQPDKIEEEEQQLERETHSDVSDLQEFNIDFRKYPTFEDYAKAHNLDIEHFDPEKSAHVKKLYEELFDLTQSVDLNLKKFPSINSFQNQENSCHETKSVGDSFLNLSKELTMKKFLTPKEYFKKIGATELLDSKSLIDNTQSQDTTKVQHDSTNSNEEFSKEWCLSKFPELKKYIEKAKISDDQKFECDKSVSNEQTKNIISNLSDANSEESLPDVNAELKRRNIMKHSFKNEIFTAGGTSDPKSDSDPDVPVGSSSSKENKDPTLFIKTKNTNDMSGVEAISKSQSSSDLGKEFEEMGLKWASLMLKKQQESKALSSSTSSSFVFQKPRKKTPSTRKDTTLESQANDKETKREHQTSLDTTLDGQFGKPLNLREFLAQELQKHTLSSTDSTSLIDESLASLFIRSLLSSGTPSPKNENDNRVEGSSDRQQKTSTPVLLGLSSSSRKSSSSFDSNGIKLFSGESRISSVRFNSESSGSNEDKSKNLKSNNTDDASKNS